MPTTTRRSARLAAPPNTSSAVAINSSASVVTPQKRKSRASKSKLTKGTKKRRTGLRNAVNTSKSLGTVDPESNIDGSILDIDGEPCDVMLVLVDPSKHMDKFFILQLIETVDDCYIVYTRWGRTGTSGQAMEQDFKDEEDAEECFCKKFKEKTGLEWENRNEPTVGKKYRFIQQNFGEKKLGYTSAKWQYWVDDQVDGKTDGWYDYSKEGSQQVERLYQESLINPRISNRIVDSGIWTYDVNLSEMIQTNVKHPNNTSRRIRRCPEGEDMDNNLPPVPLTAVSATIAVPSSPMKTASSVVTPTSSPLKAVSSSTSTESKAKAPPVDQDIDLFFPSSKSSTFKTVKDEENNDWYDVVLNQCNITGSNNNNKYYRLQLLQSKNSSKYFVWMKWGRVGERPKSNTKDLKGPFTSELDALKVFAKKYRDKTGNQWGKEFVPKKNKYTRIEIDNDVEVKEEFKTVNVKTEQIEYLPSTLDLKTKELVEVLFSKEMRDEALSAFNLDLKRLPLGVPSKQQIQLGISILNEIEDLINGSGGNGSFQELSSRFYTSIPHSFGRQRPPVINNTVSLQQRYDMCNILLDMYSTNETMRKIEEEETKVEVKKVPYPADSHYKSLNADLTVMAKSSKEFKKIQQYFNKTKGSSSSAKLIDAWKVNRHGEDARFQKFDGVGNRKLLWHGTNIAVVAPILTSGLRIMPHSGGRVGSGIYLASMQEKSAQYTSGYGSKFACMFLCEAPLGKSHQVTSDGSHASSLKKAPNGFDSVHAVGQKSPKSWDSMNLDNHNVDIPTESAADTKVKSSFYHDEFLVYDESQTRIRFVLTVKLY